MMACKKVAGQAWVRQATLTSGLEKTTKVDSPGARALQAGLTHMYTILANLCSQ